MPRNRVMNLANFQPFQAINVLSDPGAIGGPVVIANAIRVNIVWQLSNGKTAVNVIGGIVQSGFTPTATIAEAIRSGLTSGGVWTALAALMPTTTTLQRVELQDLRQPNLPKVPSTGAATPGTAAGLALPGEVAAVVTFRTNLTGPANRGRMYIPGFAVSATAAGDVISAAAMTAIQNWANNLAAVLSGQNISLAIIHPARQAYTGSSGTQHPARSASAVQITSVTIRDNHWDSQRRRGLR